MPRSGSGTYTLPSGNPVVTGTTIESNWANTTLSDIATTLSDSLSRSGQGGMTAALRVADGTQGAPGVGFANETGSGFYRAGTGEVWAVVQGAQTLNLDANGVTVPSDKATSIEGTFVFNETGADKDARFEGDTDANLLFTDASTDRVGVGTNTPAAKLDVNGTAAISGNVTLSGGTANGVLYLDGSKVATSGSALTFDGTNLGIGTSSPAYKLDVRGNSVAGNGTIATALSYDTNGLVGTISNHSLGILTNSTVVARFDTSGNLGLGVTPSAWDSGYKAFQIGTRAALTQGSSDTYLGNNWYNDGTNKYLATAAASLYGQVSGSHAWYTAPSGTAGNTISFTQAMTLDASGRLLVGTTVPQQQTSAGSIQLASGASLGSGGFSRIWVPGQQIGGATYAGLYGLASTYLAYYSGGWKSLGGGTASAITIDEGIFSFSSSQSVGASDAALTWTTRFMCDTSGNLLIGGTSTPTASAGNLVMFNGTAPTGNVTNGCTLFCEDVSSSSELKVRDEAGNVTTLSPHNFSLIPEGPSEDMAWSYYSERDGKRINIDMLKAIRVLEKLSGEQLVHEA